MQKHEEFVWNYFIINKNSGIWRNQYCFLFFSQGYISSHLIISGVAGHSFLAKVFSGSNLERERKDRALALAPGYSGHQQTEEREREDQQVAGGSLEWERSWKQKQTMNQLR